MQARISNRLPDDLLVAEMNPVKNADGQANLAAALGKLIGDLNDLHTRLTRQSNAVINTISSKHSA